VAASPVQPAGGVSGRVRGWRAAASRCLIFGTVSGIIPGSAGGDAARAADLPWPEATAVGGWWKRAFDPEIDLIGADRLSVARKLCYAGSIKWLDHPFGTRDLTVLQRGAPHVPGFDPGETALIGVSRTGFADSAPTNLALCWLPEDIIRAFG
jgi:uncharacterized protein